MLRLSFTVQFKKDYKLAIKRGFEPIKLQAVVEKLRREEPLPASLKDHPLVNSRNFKGMRECHIQPDWLLVYKVERKILTLKLIRTGTHSDLF